MADTEKPYRNRVEVFGVDLSSGTPKIYGGAFKTGGFGVFGGGTDGDDLLIAAKREFKEETGYTLTDLEKIPIDAVTAEWKPPFKSAKQAERAKQYRGTRTWYVYGVISGAKGEKANGDDGKSPLDNIGFYTCKTALEMLNASTTENQELVPQIEARKKAVLFVLAKAFGIKIEKLGYVKEAAVRESNTVKVARDLLQRRRAEKIAKFLISKGPDTAQAYLSGLRKLLAAKVPKPSAPAAPPKPKKPRRPSSAKLLEKLMGRSRSSGGYVLGD